MTEINFWILGSIQAIHTPILNFIMICISTIGNLGLIWIFIGIWMFLKGNKKTAVFLFSALVVNLIVCNGILKPWLDVSRPFEQNPSIQLLINPPKDPSFPSGHTAAAFCCVTVFYLSKEKFWYVFLILAILMAFSRLYLYVHYPTDVLGGVIVGTLSALVVYRCILWKNQRKRL